MKKRLILLAGLGVGFVLGSYSGRSSYEKLRAQVDQLWSDPRVQEQFQKTGDTVPARRPRRSQPVCSRPPPTRCPQAGRRSTTSHTATPTRCPSRRRGSGRRLRPVDRPRSRRSRADRLSRWIGGAHLRRCAPPSSPGGLGGSQSRAPSGDQCSAGLTAVTSPAGTRSPRTCGPTSATATSPHRAGRSGAGSRRAPARTSVA